MSEQTDATEDRSDDDDVDPVAGEEPDESEAEQPQPWAKALPGDPD
jgi:hypothetical protein